LGKKDNLMHLLLLLSLLIPSAPIGIIKSSDLKPGMKGYGLTVFRGTVPEKFDVEVISVIPNGLGMIKQNLILVRCKHKITDHAGIIAGMSGSPIYINGKFAGGLGYGFSFQKDPIAMLTPAEAIVGTIKRPVKKHDPWGRPLSSTFSKLWGNSRLATAWKMVNMNTGTMVRPLTVSLSVGGMTGALFSKMFPSLLPMGPVIPSGTSAALMKTAPTKFVAGGPVAVWLVSGDINVAAIGTVTHIMGNKIAIFSHPFQAMGDTRMPTAHAYIHTVIARRSSSMKLGTMTRPHGTLIKDEQATVVLDESLDAGSMPMTVEITGLGEKRRTFKYRVAKNRFITPRMVDGLVRVSMMKYYQNMTDLTYTLNYEFKLAGMKPVSFSDSFSSSSGIILGWGFFGYGNYSARGMLAINLLLNNPYKRVALEYVKVKAHIVRGLNQYKIVSLDVPSPEVRVDTEIPIKVRLKPMIGKDIFQTIKIRLPKTFKGTRVTFQVASGRYTPVEEAQPKNLTQLVHFITQTMDSHNLVLSVKTPSPAIDIEGVRIRKVPLSILDSLVRHTAGVMRRVEQTLLRTVIRTPQVMSGKAVITVLVKHKENEAQ
ncbi:hypothetical protein KKF84_19835, partial [Myxococcota bacterium]|nr:hypothetical protein [Myxococcota bacterium]